MHTQTHTHTHRDEVLPWSQQEPFCAPKWRCLRRGLILCTGYDDTAYLATCALQPPATPPRPSTAPFCERSPASPAGRVSAHIPARGPGAVVLVLRYGFNGDGLSSFDVRGPKALMYMWHIEQAAGGLHIRDPDTNRPWHNGAHV
jgi:hypothetical protein